MKDKPAADPSSTPAPARTDWTGPAKWAVIGIVTLAFMAMFKGEIGQLLRGAEEVSVGGDGVKLKIRTVSTPLGDTVLSSQGQPLSRPAGVAGPGTNNGAGQPPATPAPLPSEQQTVFTDPQTGATLAWPRNGLWVREDALAQRTGSALVLRHTSNFGNFMPNVNVRVEPVGTASVDDWMALGNQGMAAMGFELVSAQTDPATQSGVRVMRHRDVQGVLYQIQRVVIRNGQAIYVTASMLEQHAAPGVYAAMGAILNSFAVPGTSGG
ncbi:hypothetical protein [Sphaerotilus mobilis]|uniref:DUF1795 domain-containing protein n=1 Tax=Sphaerotilus mobilis TaxID=47994 RepID=A0A4Q7LTX1_9BURK|nr:hypothetical protein [Sphaerotilus mobilis]RZS58204.1 hypothetical protein EV685_0485 [Sphaerotilus mobilis]